VIELLLQAEEALSAGGLDRAEALYRQILAADPRNSIALVGLARVTLERSDEVGALTLARRSLAIDAENGAARRLVEQVEKLLRDQGVSLPAPPAGMSPTATAEGAPATSWAVEADEPVATPSPESGRHSYLDRLLRRRTDRQ
jgi:tetratricopeptide (TPR) repeat protein